MCGRLNVINDPLCGIVSEILGIKFEANTNTDLRPTQQVSVIAGSSDGICQLNPTWGLKTSWSSRLLINAQAETAREKKTFRQAMQSHRCLIPCSGWYEWRDEGDKRKQKYLFSGSKVHALFMAGIYYPNDLGAQLITLTIRPNSKCSQYHGRMPLLIHSEDIDYWLWSSADELTPLMEPVPSQAIKVDATS